MSSFRLSLLFLLLCSLVSYQSQAQVNDNCASPIVLTAGSSCVLTQYSSAGATGETVSVAPNPSCGFYQGGDVWFKTTMPVSGALRFEIEAIAGINPQFAVYSGNCGAMSQVVCNQLDSNRTVVQPALAGQSIFVRVYNYNSAQGGTFKLCVWEPVVPVNNACADAILLNVANSCARDTFSNTHATGEATSVAPNPTCGFYNGGDVWFKAVVPQSGALRIEATGISGVNPQSAIYSGSCGAFTQIVCNQLNNEKTIVVPQLAGQTVYVRIFNYNTEEGGVFSLCLWEPAIPVNDACEAAIELPVNPVCSPDTFTNANATAQLTATAPNPTCGFYNGGDVWFKAQMPQSGALRIETGGISGVNPQSAIYTGSCGAFTQILCNQLNNERTIHTPELAGQTLYIRIFNYNSEEGGVFRVCLSEPEIPVNDQCENAILLHVNGSCMPDTFTNASATSESESVAPNPSCGFYGGGDVWFKVRMPISGTLDIRRANILGVNAQFAMYSGTCGSFSQLACAQLTNTMHLDIDSLAGQFLYLRVYNYNSEEGGIFSLCVSDVSCAQAVFGSDSVTICQGDTLEYGSELITEEGIHSIIFPAASGCDSTLVLTVFVKLPFTATDSLLLCKGSSFTFPDGTTSENILSPVSYTSILQSTNSCDSLVITTIALFETDTSVQQSGNLLTANASGAVYQWIDCQNGTTIIPGETLRQFTATVNGTYAVVVTQNNCSDTSSCYQVKTIGFLDNEGKRGISVYPNPVSDKLTIKLDFEKQGYLLVQLFSIQGELILERSSSDSSETILDLKIVSKGTYFLKLHHSGISDIRLLVKAD